MSFSIGITDGSFNRARRRMVEDKGAPTVSKQELKAKTCHGVLSGQGFCGAFPMPRLAGQQPEYLQNQLQVFIERRRTNPIMFNVAYVLSPPMLKGLSEHFQGSQSKAAGLLSKVARARGEENL